MIDSQVCSMSSSSLWAGITTEKKICLGLSSTRPDPPLDIAVEDVDEDIVDGVAERPTAEMALEFGNIADPPDVIADPVRFGVADVHLVAGDLLAHGDGLHHRAIAEPADRQSTRLNCSHT